MSIFFVIALPWRINPPLKMYLATENEQITDLEIIWYYADQVV
jgi:hypothetical protein